jgi:hypothetical protein
MNARQWPVPGFSGCRRKLTLAGNAIAPKVSFLAPPRTHNGGHLPSVMVGRFGAGQHHRCDPARADNTVRACAARH